MGVKTARIKTDAYIRDYWRKRMKWMAKDIVNAQPMTSPHNKKYWPYQYNDLDWRDVLTAERWCYTHFKSGNWRNDGQWFAFKREQDYVLFLLRWR